MHCNSFRCRWWIGFYGWKAIRRAQQQQYKKKVKLKLNWTRTNCQAHQDVHQRSAAACPFNGIHAESKQLKMLHLHLYNRKLNVDCCFVVRAHACVCVDFALFFLNIGRAGWLVTVQSAQSIPCSIVNLLYICVGRKPTAHRHYVDLCTHYCFTFVLRSLIC